MRTINITNDKKRDAEVAMETRKKPPSIKRVLENGELPVTVKILKQNLALSYETLRRNYSDLISMGNAIIASDPEVDMELIGKKLGSTRKLYVRQNGQIAYRVNMFQIIKDPQGNEKERRDFTKALSNITGDSVVHWTGKKFPKAEAIRKFVFTHKMQIKHVSGLTYDFLYGMAKELHDSDSFMYMLGGKGKDPLVITQGGESYRGFLEGRIDGNKYCLILHLTNIEMKAVSA
jgi:hypothetical protein